MTRLVAPGPEVASATPTSPVTRAYPSAAWEAPCSCRIGINLISGSPYKASKIGIAAPPFTPKIYSTPSRLRPSIRICAPESSMPIFLINGSRHTPLCRNSLKLKKPSRSNFGDEKDIHTDLTVVPLQFPFSLQGSRHMPCAATYFFHKKEHSLGYDNGYHTG